MEFITNLLLAVPCSLAGARPGCPPGGSTQVAAPTSNTDLIQDLLEFYSPKILEISLNVEDKLSQGAAVFYLFIYLLLLFLIWETLNSCVFLASEDSKLLPSSYPTEAADILEHQT